MTATVDKFGWTTQTIIVHKAMMSQKIIQMISPPGMTMTAEAKGRQACYPRVRLSVKVVVSILRQLGFNIMLVIVNS